MVGVVSRESPSVRQPSRPRILIDALAYAPQDGGFTTSLCDLLRSCGEIDEFDFVVAHHRRYSSVFREFDLPTLAVGFPEKLRFFASLILLPWLTRRAGADAVHCEISALPMGVRVPGSVTVHDLYFLLDPGTGGRSLGKRITTRLYWERVYTGSLRRARVVKAISEASAGEARRLVSPDLPVAVVRHRVDPLPAPVRYRRWPQNGERVRLLFLGNIVPRKNLPFLLEALPSFRGRWGLDVVGNLGWGLADLGPMIRDPRVTVHGYLPDAERDRLLEECHLLIMPSLCEGFCYPVAEAMSRGMPVLTSRTGAFPEYVPEECQFGLDDPGCLAELYNRLDAESYDRLRASCDEAVRQFSSETHIRSHRALFQRLTNGA